MRTNLPKIIRKTNECGIINLDEASGFGTHWTAYKKHKDSVIYFDSFGNLRPPIEVVKYFQSNGHCEIFYNHQHYQRYNSFNCGHLCLLFLFNNNK